MKEDKLDDGSEGDQYHEPDNDSEFGREFVLDSAVKNSGRELSSTEKIEQLGKSIADQVLAKIRWKSLTRDFAVPNQSLDTMKNCKIDDAMGKLIDQAESKKRKLDQEFQKKQDSDSSRKRRMDMLESSKQLTELHAEARNNSYQTKLADDGWFNLPSSEPDEKLKHTLRLLKMRSSLATNSFYKSSDGFANASMLQLGTIKAGAFERSSSSDVKKGSDMIDQFVNDPNIGRGITSRYKKFQQAHRRVTKLRKKGWNGRSKLRKSTKLTT